MKIAVIGSGIAGLTAAHYLRRAHDITVFEAGSYAGGHTNTIDVEWQGERHAIDTGFIVFNQRNYPLFTALLEELGVAWQPTSMSFSIRCDRTGLEYNGTSLNTLFAQRTNLLRPTFLRMVRDILRFNREAPALEGVDGDLTTVEEYVQREGYGTQFAERYLIPLGASLWSCPAGTFRKFPIRFVVEFLSNHAMLQVDGRPVWRVIRGGSKRYVEKLIAPFSDRILLNTPVTAVERRQGFIRIRDGRGGEGRFDHVIFACHSDQALRTLQDATLVERELLSAFPYQPNEAILHTDASVLPRRRLAWASWNYRIPREDAERVAVTYNMNILQSLRSKHVFNVTLNDGGDGQAGIDPARVIRRISYEHPIFTANRAAAQRRHGELIGVNRTSYCGAYWGYGFHEDGVRSATAVCGRLARELAA